jgi:hypothetical protein
MIWPRLALDAERAGLSPALSYHSARLFEADSAETVRSVGTRARIQFDRIVEAVERR